MKKFTNFDGLVAPYFRANIDTDMIIPKQFLKSIKRSGFGPNLFDELRYLDEGQPGVDNSQRPLNKDFVLNKARYQGASILLAGENFGCGSSREHAPWALEDFGIKVVIAPSYADIFYNNCFKNGMLPIVMPTEQIEKWVAECEATEGYTLHVDLEAKQIVASNGDKVSFEVDEFRQYCLINGLDDIGLTLAKQDLIKQYEQKQAQVTPWLYKDLQESK